MYRVISATRHCIHLIANYIPRGQPPTFYLNQHRPSANPFTTNENYTSEIYFQFRAFTYPNALIISLVFLSFAVLPIHFVRKILVLQSSSFCVHSHLSGTRALAALIPAHARASLLLAVCIIHARRRQRRKLRLVGSPSAAIYEIFLRARRDGEKLKYAVMSRFVGVCGGRCEGDL